MSAIGTTSPGAVTTSSCAACDQEACQENRGDVSSRATETVNGSGGPEKPGRVHVIVSPAAMGITGWIPSVISAGERIPSAEREKETKVFGPRKPTAWTVSKERATSPATAATLVRNAASFSRTPVGGRRMPTEAATVTRMVVSRGSVTVTGIDSRPSASRHDAVSNADTAPCRTATWSVDGLDAMVKPGRKKLSVSPLTICMPAAKDTTTSATSLACFELQGLGNSHFFRTMKIAIHSQFALCGSMYSYFSRWNSIMGWFGVWGLGFGVRV